MTTTLTACSKILDKINNYVDTLKNLKNSNTDFNEMMIYNICYQKSVYNIKLINNSLHMLNNHQKNKLLENSIYIWKRKIFHKVVLDKIDKMTIEISV